MTKKKRDKKRDILITCQYFFPDRNSSAALPYDTARYFASCGYTVDVLCGFPKEYSGGRKAPLKEQIDGIHIRRIPYIQSRRNGKIGRIINYLSFTAGAFAHLSTLKNYRCVICYSNPPILPLAVVKSARWSGTKAVFVAYDLYPEIAYASSSIRKGSLMDRFMRYVNREVYRNADMVIALSEEMREFILERRPDIDKKRVTVIHNWAHEENEDKYSTVSDSTEQIMLGESEGRDDPKRHVPNDIKVSYFGNMGICQDIDSLLKAAIKAVNDQSLIFEFIGAGNKKEDVEQCIRDNRLKNTHVYGYMTGELLREKLQESHCCVVSLTEGLRGMCVPSKYYTYLYAGKPIIAVMEKDLYIAKEILNENIGYAIANGDSEGLIRAVRYLQDNPLVMKSMGERAKKLYQRKYSYQEAMKKYKEVIERFLES